MDRCTEVGIGPGDIASDGGVAPPTERAQQPPFSAHVYCGQMAGWMRIPLGTEVGLGLGDIVLHGHPAAPWKGAQQPPHFSAHVCCGGDDSVLQVFDVPPQPIYGPFFPGPPG